jgi:hypothetical protein
LRTIGQEAAYSAVGGKIFLTGIYSRPAFPSGNLIRSMHERIFSLVHKPQAYICIYAGFSIRSLFASISIMTKSDFTEVQYAKTCGSAIFEQLAGSRLSQPVTAEIKAAAPHRL